ncbi:MAG: hypothetical protein ACPGVY_01980 [Mycobacterium sp.]
MYVTLNAAAELAATSRNGRVVPPSTDPSRARGECVSGGLEAAV